MRRKSRRRDLAEVREYVASEHEASITYWAEMTGGPDSSHAIRSRAWVAAVRAGESVLIRWFELPEGTLPLPRGGPSEEFVLTSDGRIVPEYAYREEQAAAS